MNIAPQFNVPPLNAHYEGDYTPRTMQWRELCSRNKARNLRDLVPANVETVLEVGCGTAAVLSELKNGGFGSSHIGIDVADPHEHASPAAQELDLRSYDGERLPFEDASFDLVYASHVLEHVPDERGFLSEVRRVAGNWIYIEVPCELHLRTSRAELQRTLDIGHINAYTPESFALTLATSGLKVEKLRVFDHSYEVHAFQTSPLKARIKSAVRGGLLKTAPTLAPRLLTYHTGALCRPD